MTELVITDLESGLKSLFYRAYLANCELEEQQPDLETLKALGPLEVLENFKDLVESLLSCKRDLKRSDKGEIVNRCDQFEAMLQRLEAEVRTHYRVEQQLKLQAETLQAQLEQQGGDQTHRRVLSLQSEGKASHIYELAAHKHKALLRLEKQALGMKVALDRRVVEVENVKQDYERLMRELQLSRVRKAQAVLLRQRSDISPDRALTDRKESRNAEGHQGRSYLDRSPFRREHSRPKQRPMSALKPRT